MGRMRRQFTQSERLTLSSKVLKYPSLARVVVVSPDSRTLSLDLGEVRLLKVNETTTVLGRFISLLQDPDGGIQDLWGNPWEIHGAVN